MLTSLPRPPSATRTARVRSARLTDLSALGDLSRLSHGSEDGADAPVRSLGLPVSGSQVSVFTLFRLPLGAFRPHDQLYVYEEEGRLAGLARVERDGIRDEWTIVELDAIDHGDAGDIRFRLIQHLLRDGSKRGASRFHVACADHGGNVELFMQAGFARYGEERILYRPPDSAPVPLPADEEVAAARIRPAVPLDALQLHRLYQAATPAAVTRLEGYRLPDWERQGTASRVPRSSLTPILRFADVDAFVQEARPERSPELVAFAQIGVAKEEQPHYLRVIVREGQDPSTIISYAMAVIAERSRSAREGARRRVRAGVSGRARAWLEHHGHDHGIVSTVRTYESPLDRRLAEAGFAPMADVSLFLKETLVRVAEPALVPVATR